jgi:hypothetical protein
MNPTARSFNFDKKIQKKKLSSNQRLKISSTDSKHDSQPQYNVNYGAERTLNTTLNVSSTLTK